LALAGRRDADDVPATIVRVALPLDQLAPLERIQHCDDAARVEPQRVGERRLSLACPFGEDRQDAVVVGVESPLFELRQRLRLEADPDAGKQEAAALEQLLRHAWHRTGGDLSGRDRHCGISVARKRCFVLPWSESTIGGSNGLALKLSQMQ